MKSKSRFRVSAYDAPVRPKLADVAPKYVRILDENGNQRGHLHGMKSSAVSVSRFGVHDAKRKKINGETVWQGRTAAAPQASGKITAQREQAKGSAKRGK
jgi:hypothetical protein